MAPQSLARHAVQLARFSAVGLFCFAVGIVILTALHELLGIHYLVAYVVAFVITSSLGYVLNGRYTFGARNRDRTGALRYMLVNGSLLAVNGLLLRLLVERFHLWYLGATVLLAGLNTPVSFLSHRLVSYRLGRDSNHVVTAAALPGKCRRVVTVTHFFPAHGGGLELVAEKLVAEFAARGVVVEWFASNTDPAPHAAANRIATPVATLDVIERFTQIPYPLWSPTAVPALWRAIGRADIVHIHEHLYLGSILGVLLARIRRRPIVITQHAGAVGMSAKSMRLLYAVTTRLLGRVIFATATRAVFISANVRSFFDLDGCVNTRLIYNGIDLRLFAPQPRAERQTLRLQLGLPPDRKIVLFVGRFVRKKGVHVVTQLAARLRDVLWVFVGSGPEDPASCGLDNVLVAGKIKQENLAPFYHAADLLLLPSLGEGFPLVVQEALACGLGVLSTEEVGTACPQAQDMIRVQPTPRTEEAIPAWERAVRETLADESYLDAREPRASRAHALWSWNRCTSEYLSLFDEIVVKA